MIFEMKKETGVIKRIHKAFLECLETRPFHKIRIVDLCKAAQISRSTFYAHFESIDDILQNIEDEFFDGLFPGEEYIVKKGDTYWKERTLSLSMVTARYLKDNHRMFKLLLGPNSDKSFETRLINHIRKIFDKYLTSSTRAESSMERKVRCEYAANGIIGLMRWWSLHANDLSTEELAILVRKCMSQAFIS